MLVSGKPRDLTREEECTLLLAVKHGLALKALARSMKAQGKVGEVKITDSSWKPDMPYFTIYLFS
jgi:hypothetical protein